VGANDMVHIQWTGNDNTNNNGEGTDNEDRHNIVQVAMAGMDAPMAESQADMFDVEWEWNPDTAGEFSGSRDKAELVKQAALSKQTNCLTEAQINGDQQRQNCQKLNNADATVDLGLLKFKSGEYKYMSSRNMNFSNRAQKAMLQVSTASSVMPNAPVGVVVEQVAGTGEKGALTVSWASPGSETAAIGYDGQEYWGMEQQNTPVVDYQVLYSTDGGTEWVSAGPQCSGVVQGCTIDGLPAGTPTLVKVQAGGTAGFGVASNIVAASTADSALSAECKTALQQQADGSYISSGTIVAIVFGVIAVLLLIGAAIFVMKRRQPPPPPKPNGAQPPAY